LQILDQSKVRARLSRADTGKRKSPKFAALGRKERLHLKASINQARTRERLYRAQERYDATYKVLKRVERVSNAARALLNALNEGDSSLFVYWPEKTPEADDIKWIESKYRFAVAFTKKIVQMSENGLAEIRQYPGKRDSSSSARYWFIRELSRHYEKAFGQRPSSTLGGPWEIFLGEVLARCRGDRPLSEQRVHALWLQAALMFGLSNRVARIN
jgi:hypothetical protein